MLLSKRKEQQGHIPIAEQNNGRKMFIKADSQVTDKCIVSIMHANFNMQQA